MRTDAMKRLVIYFHYDARGHLDEPCRFAIRALKADADLLLVSNGALDKGSRAWAMQEKIRFLERENVGLDVGAYREALFSLGREVVCQYDELVLMNYTLAGPVSPLAAMWHSMEQLQELDFWGLTRHYAMRSRRFGGEVPEHLQSHFLAIRRRMLCSDVFWQYWQQMQLPKSYEESVARHETRFTRYFSEHGYTWDSYVQTDDLKSVFVNPIMACPRELLENRGCPFYKRRSFFTPYEDELRRTDGNAAAELYTYLRSRTAYPVDELLRSLLRTQSLAALGKNMHWHYIVQEQKINAAVDLQAKGLCLVRFSAAYDEDPVLCWYLRKSVEQADRQLLAAAELFTEYPLLGVLSPALPLWPEALSCEKKSWQKSLPWLREQVGVPMGAEPPAAPMAGWALVRADAFPKGIPAVHSAREIWLFPLVAQQNGYYSATMESAEQAAARSDYGDVYRKAAEKPATVAKQFARLIKHRLKA